MRPTLLYSIYYLVLFSIVLFSPLSCLTFPVTPKYMTLNDVDWVFGVKFCFRAGLASRDRAISEKNKCVKSLKTNKDRHILSAMKIFGWDLVSGDIRFVRIFGWVL